MSDREAEVWARLSQVVDPELDEPVTDLGFVTSVRVGGDGHVAVGFRLPTYWCAANFAYLMADDMRREVARLPWARGFSVMLEDHMYADEINRGIGEGRSFRGTFGAEAEGEDVEDVRRLFLLKALQRRQLALLEHLLAAGHQPAALLALDIGGLRALATDAAAARLVARYLARRDVVGEGDSARAAFVDRHGQPVGPGALHSHMRALRSVAINVEFNGSLCRALLAARYDDAPAAGAGPGLIDFIRELPRQVPPVRS